MRRIVYVLAAGGLLTACESASELARAPFDYAQEVAAERKFAQPPPLEPYVANLGESDPCDERSQTTARLFKDDDPYLKLIKTCTPVWPSLLRTREIKAVCTATFDIDEAGVPVGISSECEVDPGYIVDDADAWRAFAKPVFELQTQRAIAQTRREAPVGALAQLPRQKYGMRFRFEYVED